MYPVTTSSTLAAAEHADRHIRPGQFFADGNSVCPATKETGARLIDAAGGDYVEAAVIWVVPSRGIEVPVIPGAGKCAELAQLPAPADVRLNPGVAKIGFASARKMCRNIMVKGLEALTVERVPTARC